jgi:hypothetical protein
MEEFVMSATREENNLRNQPWKSAQDTAHSAAGAVADKAKNVIGGAENAIDAATEKVGEYAGQARDKVGEYAGQAKDKVQELANSAAECATQMSGKAQEWAGQAADKTSAAVKNLGSEMTDLVRRYPAQAMLVGFGLGYLLARAAGNKGPV